MAGKGLKERSGEGGRLIVSEVRIKGKLCINERKGMLRKGKGVPTQARGVDFGGKGRNVRAGTMKAD